MSTRPPILYTLAQIARHWRMMPESDIYRHTRFDYAGAGEPFCFRCGWLAPVDDTPPKDDPWKVWNRARGFLERAHLVDYAALVDQGRTDEDTIGNLVPLCQWCHRRMPEHDDIRAATDWVVSGRHCGSMRQTVTDLVNLDGCARSDLRKIADRVLADMWEHLGRRMSEVAR